MPRSTRIAEFDVWRPDYGGATVAIYEAGTTTLASAYSDPNLTTAAANPQTLLSFVDSSGQNYGRWQAPLYVGTPYQLTIDGDQTTGIERLAIHTLAEEDASEAVVTPANGSVARALEDIAADVVRTESFGTLGASSATNTTILAAAIGAAAAAGGGEVACPAGNFPYTTLTIPADVVVRGQGRGVTTLRSSEAQATITLGGDRAGFRRLTLDGVSLVSGSIGIYAVGRNDVVMDDVEIKRFATGILKKGGDRPRFDALYISNCTKGAEIRGDTDVATSNGGGPVRSLSWLRGKVDLCTTFGVLLSYEDALAVGFDFVDVDFLDNTGTAFKVNGARQIAVRGGRFEGNTTNIDIEDDSDLSAVASNTVRQVEFNGTRFSGGIIAFDDTCEQVRLVGCSLEDIDLQVSIPTNPIVLQDCYEDSLTTVAGSTEKLLRTSMAKRGEVPGVTTDAAWTTAWSTTLAPGDVVRLRARVIGRQRNGLNTLSGEIVGTATRAPADLGFDTAVGTLDVGDTITGVTSGATARIVAVAQVGASGTLSLRDIIGVFVAGENLSTSSGDTAKCSTPLTNPAVTVDPANVAKVTPAPETETLWDYDISAATPLVRIQVKGATSQTIEWLVEFDVFRN